jgi:hypothetical protein
MSLSQSTAILWMGWSSMLIALFLPIVTIPEGEPLVGSLVMFLGLHDVAYGWQVALALIIAPMKYSAWLIFSVPVWLGLVAPVFLWVKSKVANSFFALLYGIGFLMSTLTLIFSHKVGELIAIGYFVWIMALFVLMVSRINACFDN